MGVKEASLGGAPEAHHQDIPEYTIRRSPRAKTVRLRVNIDGTVCVTVPPTGRVTGYDDFVRKNADWVRRQQAKFATIRAQPRGFGVCDGSVAYRGKPVTISTQTVPGTTVSLRYDEERFLVYRPVEATDDDVRNLLRRWFREVARTLFHERVSVLNKTTAYPWQRIRIGEQTTKWGSCSSKGTLSFNWRLLMAPPEILDYVVIHELAHLRVPNHSPDFWALVEQQCADHKEHRRWLNKNGHALML